MFVPTEEDNRLVRNWDRSSDHGRRDLADEHRERPRPIDDDLAAWLAEYGHLPRPSTAPTHDSDDHPADVLDGQPDAQFLLRLSAQKLFAEGRVNPMSIPCVTWVGTWRTDDRVTWRTPDAAWLAQLERSNSGRHVSLAIYHHGVYQGRQDASGFHLPIRESRSRRPRPAARSLRLPLAG
jgi:hypothetical protein